MHAYSCQSNKKKFMYLKFDKKNSKTFTPQILCQILQLELHLQTITTKWIWLKKKIMLTCEEHILLQDLFEW